MLRRTSVVAGAMAGAVALALLLGVLIGSGVARGLASPERGSARSTEVPLRIPIAVVARCEQNAGLGGSAPVTSIWRDATGLHVAIGLGAQYAVGSDVSTTESTLRACLTAASGTAKAYPVDSVGLLLLWRYSVGVLWPCFARHGVDVGPAPSRAAFLRDDPRTIDPFTLIPSGVSDGMRTRLQRDCPPLPSYLAGTSG